MIGKGHGGEVRLHGVPPLASPLDPFVGGGNMLQIGQVDGILTEIREVVLSHGGELDLIARMHVEPFLGGIHGNVRTIEPDSHKEGLVVFLF